MNRQFKTSASKLSNIAKSIDSSLKTGKAEPYNNMNQSLTSKDRLLRIGGSNQRPLTAIGHNLKSSRQSKQEIHPYAVPERKRLHNQSLNDVRISRLSIQIKPPT